jgi:hypothetical protein
MVAAKGDVSGAGVHAGGGTVTVSGGGLMPTMMIVAPNN